MRLAHVHPAVPTGPATPETVLAVAGLLAAAAYLSGAARLRRRGDAWPRRRDASFAAGAIALAWAGAGAVPGGPFTGHMTRHLLLGMVGPLLVVLARPLTLVLRALPAGTARRGVLALAHSRLLGVLVFPPLAALLDVGGLWLLYRTHLFAALGDNALLHAMTYAQVPAAGLLFSFAACQLDPLRRRWSPAVRGGALLAAGAAHAVLARVLYTSPPPGTAFTGDDLHTGVRLMYYGGDVVEAALALVLGVGWYTARARRDSRAQRVAPLSPSRQPRAASPRS
ncbi:cytochrome c oxidase assembly factor CtaG [Streptomyces sp. SAI-170]|uniref:cytochrome c oxidase assembly protein n=1 Tax=Streptomyces sp. SAI-170 TaxID=3377729 RepID=UPI003C7DD947